MSAAHPSRAYASRDRRLRPLAALELFGLLCLIVVVLWVYVAKAAGASERTAIVRTEADIARERALIRLREAEVAHLERPARLEGLAARHTDLAPVDALRESRLENLDALAGPAAEARP